MFEKLKFKGGGKLALALLALLVVSFCGLTWAQSGGESPNCFDAQSWYDKGCSENTTCPLSGTTQCSVYNFTAECGGTYILTAWTACPVTNCFHCQSCVTIFDGGSEVAHCVSSLCAQQECLATCSVSLTQDYGYQAVVCLSRCPSDQSCSLACGAQGAECAAWGCIRYGTTACP